MQHDFPLEKRDMSTQNTKLAFSQLKKKNLTATAHMLHAIRFLLKAGKNQQHFYQKAF